MTRVALFLAIFAATAGFDQGTKQWARTLPVSSADCEVPAALVAHRCAGVPQPVIEGYWDWELAMNPGAAFSSLVGGRWLLTALAFGALIVIGVVAARTRAEQRLARVALALIAGGTLGNLIDRLRDGAVTDFIRWRYGDLRWPIFNVADVALVVGVALLLIEAGLSRRHARTSPA